jgi:hypothetical protein
VALLLLLVRLWQRLGVSQVPLLQQGLVMLHLVVVLLVVGSLGASRACFKWWGLGQPQGTAPVVVMAVTWQEETA